MWSKHQSHYSYMACSRVLCCHQVLVAFVHYQSTHPQQNQIYLLPVGFLQLCPEFNSSPLSSVGAHVLGIESSYHV